MAPIKHIFPLISKGTSKYRLLWCCTEAVLHFGSNCTWNYMTVFEWYPSYTETHHFTLTVCLYDLKFHCFWNLISSKRKGFGGTTEPLTTPESTATRLPGLTVHRSNNHHNTWQTVGSRFLTVRLQASCVWHTSLNVSVSWWSDWTGYDTCEEIDSWSDVWVMMTRVEGDAELQSGES